MEAILFGRPANPGPRWPGLDGLARHRILQTLKRKMGWCAEEDSNLHAR